MRVLGCLVLLLLAGCTSGDGLDAYLMRPDEAPDGCGLLDMDSDAGQALRDDFGLHRNPGAFNASVFAADGIQPVANRVAVYACDEARSEPAIFSAVERFATVADADAWFEARIECDESPTFRDGAVLGAIEPVRGRWNDAHLQAAIAAGERILRQTGAEAAC